MLFVIGGVVPLVAAALVLRFLLPESPRFLARHESRWTELVDLMPDEWDIRWPPGTRFVDHDRSRRWPCVARVRSSRPSSCATPSRCGAAFFFCLLSVYLGFSWLTSLLTGAGFAPGTANTGITAFNLGGVVGALLGGVAIARLGSRLSMLTMACDRHCGRWGSLTP